MESCTYNTVLERNVVFCTINSADELKLLARDDGDAKMGIQPK